MSSYSWSIRVDSPHQAEMHDDHGRVIATVNERPDGLWHWKRHFATGPNSEGTCGSLREAKQRVLNCTENDPRE
jgi:hypothetical protein